MRSAKASTWQTRGHVRAKSVASYEVVQVVNSQPTYADIRCTSCHRLLFKWKPSGLAVVSVKCPRCGTLDNLQLTT